MLKRLELTVIMLFAAWTVTAKTVAFHSGELLAAELSERKPALPESLSGVNLQLQQPTYARLVFTLLPGRNISIHDYSLEVFGTEFPAVAVASEDGVWYCDGKTISGKGAGELYSLLFVLDRNLVGRQPTEKVFLRCMPDEHRDRKQSITLRNRRGQDFTALPAVRSGIMTD